MTPGRQALRAAAVADLALAPLLGAAGWWLLWEARSGLHQAGSREAFAGGMLVRGLAMLTWLGSGLATALALLGWQGSQRAGAWRNRDTALLAAVLAPLAAALWLGLTVRGPSGG